MQPAVVRRVRRDLLERTDGEVERSRAIAALFGQRPKRRDDALSKILPEGADRAGEYARVVERPFDRVLQLSEILQVEDVAGRKNASRGLAAEREHLVVEIGRLFRQHVGKARQDVHQALLDVDGLLVFVRGFEPNGQLVVRTEQIERRPLRRYVRCDRPLVDVALSQRQRLPEFQDLLRRNRLAVAPLLGGIAIPRRVKGTTSVLLEDAEIAEHYVDHLRQLGKHRRDVGEGPHRDDDLLE